MSAYLGNTYGQPAETALALSHLVFGGTLDRRPSLKILAAHGGGFLPTYIGRPDHAGENRPDARGCADRPSSYLRRIWYDAFVCTPQALRHLVKAVGADKVVLGTDSRSIWVSGTRLSAPRPRACPAADLSAILSVNAASLLGL